MVSPHRLQEDQCLRLTFTFKWLVLWEALAQLQGLRSICHVVTWPTEGAFLPEPASSLNQKPLGFCKFLFENQPSRLSPHLEDVGSSWHWVVDAVDGEDNRGQGIDGKT